MNKIYLIILVAFTVWSCDDFLDVEPKGKAIPKTIEDFEMMLNNTSLGISHIAYMNPDTYVADVNIPDIGLEDANSYKWAEQIYNVATVDVNWQHLYQILYYCNFVINNIDGASSINGNEKLKKEVKGQAHAQRAHIYFWLVNMYAKHINETSMETDPAVPMKMGTNLDEKLPRASVAEIYGLIESDLEVAEDLVPTGVGKGLNFKPTLNGINALKAKIELFKGNFTAALPYANSVISEVGEDFNDYNNIPSRQAYQNSIDLQSYLDIESIWRGSINHSTSLSSTTVVHYLTAELKSLYTDKENDLRYQYWLTDTTDAGVSFPENRTKLVNYFGKTITASVPEMYLIRAECYARRGNAGDEDLAMADLNKLRSFRFVTGCDYELTATDAADALRIVKEERRRELIGRGLNWFDLRRYQQYGDVVDTYTRTVNGETITLAPGSNRYTLPIPEYIMELNGLLTQNPR